MPQFDFANVFVPQLFWLAVFFVVLYFGIVRPTLPRLGRTMDQRAAKIDGDLEAARQAKDAADELAGARRSALESARELARTRLADAKAQASSASEAKVAAADATVAAELEQAENRIAAAVNEARNSMREVAADSARAIVAKLTGREPDADRVGRAIETALAGRGQDK